MTDRGRERRAGWTMARARIVPINSRRIMGGCAALLVLILAFFLDENVDRWVAAHRIPALETAAKLCSRFLAWHYLMLAAGAGVLVAWLGQRGDWMRVLCVMIIAASLAGLSADLVRGLTGRTRPYVEGAQGWHGVHDGSGWLVIKHAYNSFPSGHTSAAVGFGLPLVFWRRRLALAVVPFICAVAGARVYLGAHHASDVVAAALLASLIAALVWQRFNPSGRIFKAPRSGVRE